MVRIKNYANIRAMVKHVRGNITPPPQELGVVDPLAFARLPEIVQAQVRAFYGDGLSLTTAVISATSHLDPGEREKIQHDFFLAFGYQTED